MTYLTLLNEMMSSDLEQAIQQLKILGIRHLDLNLMRVYEAALCSNGQPVEIAQEESM